MVVCSLISRGFGGFFVDLFVEIDEKSKNEILKLKELPNERLEGSWGALWLGIRAFVGFKLGVVGLQGGRKLMKSQKNEILKLKELPNERIEGSWGTVWLGIRTFFGFKLGVVGLQGQNMSKSKS